LDVAPSVHTPSGAQVPGAAHVTFGIQASRDEGVVISLQVTFQLQARIAAQRTRDQSLASDGELTFDLYGTSGAQEGADTQFAAADQRLLDL